jgi:Zn-dependent peptidase ImmA (M78 family)/transcriptional regulator with XRE-family HTH domain
LDQLPGIFARLDTGGILVDVAETKPTAKRTVSPRALEWARSRSLFSYADVAEKLHLRTIDASTVESWERGKGQPSAAQVQSLAKIFRIPERWLYYDEPPRAFDDLGIVDFRTSDQRPLTTLTPNLRSAIEHALTIQAWVVDYRAGNEDEPVALVGAKSDRESPSAIADYLRTTLDVEQMRQSAKDADAFFSALRRKVEALGVLVLRMGQVANKTAWSLNPEEFKGFTLIDKDHLAPLIFINRKDLNDAQLFTLGHELAHLVTGGSGVSNEDIENFDEDRPDIERFCDAVAEELLVPSARFEQAWGQKKAKGLDRRRIEHVAAELKVPSLLAGRRAVSLERAAPRSFHKFVTTLREQPSTAASGGTQYTNMPSWYGEDLVRLLASAATTDHPAGSDALELLGVRFDTALKLAQSKQTRPISSLPKMEPFPLIEIDDSWR